MASRLKTVLDIDHGWRRIKRELKKAAKADVYAGLFEEDVYENGQNVAEVGAYNEYGTSTIPARPFIRPALDNDFSSRVLKTEEKKLLSSMWRGTKTAAKLNEGLAELIVEKIKHNIETLTDPPLSPVTIKKKGSDKPLIDTGLMLASVKVKKEL